MTQDVQHDRSAAPLASVSDEIRPTMLEPTSDTATDGVGLSAGDPETHATASAAAERDSFEGFGSFG